MVPRSGSVALVALIALAAAQLHTMGAARAADDERVAVVKDLYTAFSAGNVPKILSLLAPDVLWIMHGPEHVIPYAGTYKGREGVEQFFADVAGAVDVLAIGQRHFATQANVVSVLGWERGVVKATGGEYLANWVHLFTIERNLVTRFEEVTDSGAILEAFTPADVERGKAYFTTCSGCHGLNSEGNAGMHAPRLTVQGADYLVRQLRNFRRQIRGGPQDLHGWQMNGRATALPGDRAVRDVVAYIETLPGSRAEATVRGDVDAGRMLYAGNCANCHGATGEGQLAVGAPALVGLDDWYQLAQLQGFKTGLRGTHAEDPLGAQMRSPVEALGHEQALRDIVAFMATWE